MILRDYQRAAVDALLAWFTQAGRRGENPLVVMPTGTGKTVTFGTLVREWCTLYPGVRFLILAHRQELVTQAEDKIKALWPGAPVGVYVAGLRRRELRQITIASRDSLAPRLAEIGTFDLVIVDEAHNIAPKEATQYRKIISCLRARNPDLHVFGFTATPWRTGSGYIYGDDKDHLFSGVAYEVNIRDMIDRGYLCPPSAKAVSDGVIDTAGIKTTAGDFNKGQLDIAARDVRTVRASLSEWYFRAFDRGRRATLFYCVSVAHADLVSKYLATDYGLDMPVLTGTTPAAERADLLARFDAGNLAGLVNVSVLTEGLDVPRVDCIAIMRPTKSLGLYLQMVGRGLRLHPDKENCRVLDFGGCIERFGPIDKARPASRKKIDDRTKVCPDCDEIVPFYARKCPACPHEFQAQPFKDCPECGAPNAPSAASCDECGALFVTHNTTAATGGILSTEPNETEYEVTGISWHGATAKKTGKHYLRLAFHSGMFETFYQNLMIGYPGFAGRKAAKEWAALTRDDVETPLNPGHAARLLEGGALRPIRAVTVDLASKWKDITEVHYEESDNDSATRPGPPDAQPRIFRAGAG